MSNKSSDDLCCLQVTSVAESAAGPNTGLQGFVGLLGVLAVPVVGYSLLTLYKTGGKDCLFWTNLSSHRLLWCTSHAVSSS